MANVVPQITRFQTFSNIYELKLFMHNLQIATGTKYKIEKVDYFSRYTAQYDRYMYKKVIYRCCGVTPSEPCFSFVVAETVGVFLQIVDCDSRHTHNGKIVPRALPTVTFVGVAALDPDPEFTMTFKNLFEGTSFLSFNELQEHFNRFYEVHKLPRFHAFCLIQITGACYIRRHTTKLPHTHVDSKTCVYRRLTLDCKHSGTFKSRSTHGVSRKYPCFFSAYLLPYFRSKMINCPSRLNFIYENGALKILNYNLRHNHLLSPVAIPKDERPKVASRRRFHLRQLCSNNTRKISVPQAFMSNSWSMEPVVTAHVPNQPDPFLRGSADRYANVS
uniref:SPATA6 domain-containing protein n=1 Tax=Mesocestoides corti TaxID=53468 RepID=A0A5K3FAY5_MESCO